MLRAIKDLSIGESGCNREGVRDVDGMGENNFGEGINCLLELDCSNTMIKIVW